MLVEMSFIYEKNMDKLLRVKLKKNSLSWPLYVLVKLVSHSKSAGSLPSQQNFTPQVNPNCTCPNDPQILKLVMDNL